MQCLVERMVMQVPPASCH